MQVDQEGRSLIERFEGLVLYAYDDRDPGHRPIKPGDRVLGVLTIGYGHTGADVVPGMTITKDQADTLLDNDLDRFEADVTTAVNMPLSQPQFNALVSLCYNIGIGNFNSSTLLKVLNDGRYDAVPAQFMRWVHDGDQVLAGLTARRAAEVAMWNETPTLDPVNNTCPKCAQPINAAAYTGSSKTAVAGGALGVMTTFSAGVQVAQQTKSNVDVVTGIMQDFTHSPWPYVVCIGLALAGYLIYEYVVRRREVSI